MTKQDRTIFVSFNCGKEVKNDNSDRFQDISEKLKDDTFNIYLPKCKESVKKSHSLGILSTDLSNLTGQLPVREIQSKLYFDWSHPNNHLEVSRVNL